MNYLTCIIILCRLIKVVFNACDADYVNSIDQETYLFSKGTYNGSLTDCGCDEKTVCVRKCCAEKYFIRDAQCVFNDSVDFKSMVYKKREKLNHNDFDFIMIFGLINCVDSKMLYHIPANGTLNDTSLLQRDSRLWIPEYNSYANLEDYCLENLDDSGFYSLVCLPEYLSDSTPNRINMISLMVSMVFLFLTFAAYLIMPEKNLYTKCMMSYVSALFFAYLTLYILQKDVNYRQSVCVILGFLCIFFFMVSFFWMNTIAFDIWRTFRGMRNLAANQADIERRRFMKYSTYAWGVPVLHSALVITLTFTLEDGVWYNPDVGYEKCWLKMGYTSLLYFFGPLGVIVTVNVVFYAQTTWNIYATQSEVREQMNCDRRDDIRRYKLFVTLFMTMGVNWSLELVSWYVMWQHGKMYLNLLHATDLANGAYGVFIFFLLVFKKKTWKTLKDRYEHLKRVSQRIRRTFPTSGPTEEIEITYM